MSASEESTNQENGNSANLDDSLPENEAKQPKPANHIYLGKHPVMSYSMSALIQLAQTGEVVLKARGMVIARAVDVAEIVTKRLGDKAYVIKNVKIDSELIGYEGDQRNISTMEIVLGRRE